MKKRHIFTVCEQIITWTKIKEWRERRLKFLRICALTLNSPLTAKSATNMLNIEDVPLTMVEGPKEHFLIRPLTADWLSMQFSPSNTVQKSVSGSECLVLCLHVKDKVCDFPRIGTPDALESYKLWEIVSILFPLLYDCPEIKTNLPISMFVISSIRILNINTTKNKIISASKMNVYIR